MEGVEEMTGTEDWRGANFTVSRSLIAKRENSFLRCLFDAGALDSSAKATARSMTFTDRVLEEFFSHECYLRSFVLNSSPRLLPSDATLLDLTERANKKDR